MKTREPDGHTGNLRSADLSLRNSDLLWGPLRLTVSHHRESATLGYWAGVEAFRQLSQEGARYRGFLTLESFRRLMDEYLTQPAYRPRQLTETIEREWRALFLLAWSNQVIEHTTVIERQSE